MHENAKITIEFRNRRAAIVRLAIILGVLSVAVLILAYQGMAPKYVSATILILFFVFAAIVNLRLWRCPACNGHLGKLYLGLNEPRYCPRCGVKLIED